MVKQFKRWRYMRWIRRIWRRFFAGSITILELHRELWAAWLWWRGRKWRRSVTAAEILKERKKTSDNITMVLKDCNYI